MTKKPPDDSDRRQPPPQKPRSAWLERARAAAEAAARKARLAIEEAAQSVERAALLTLIDSSMKTISDAADNAKWQALRRLTIERTKSCLREWAREEWGDPKRETLAWSAAAFLQKHLQSRVQLRPEGGRHKPDLIVDEWLALRFLLKPDNLEIDGALPSLIKMSEAFTTLLVICNGSEEVLRDTRSKLDGNVNLHWVSLPGGIVLRWPPGPRTKRIFLSHTDHDQDKEWARQLRVHLNPLRHKYDLWVWDPSMLLPGEDESAERKKMRSTANMIIVLVSADYLDREFEELEAILDRADLLPIRVRALPLFVGFSNPDLFPRLLRHPGVNTPELPLNTMKDHGAEAVLGRVAREVEAQLEKWRRTGL